MLYTRIFVVYISLSSLALQAQKQEFISVFGDQIVGEREDYVNTAFQYGIPDIATTSTVVDGGFVTTFTSMAVIRTDGTPGSTAQVQSNSFLRYRAGHEGFCFFTAAFTGDIANNSEQFIGAWDDNNGFAVGYDGTDFSILFKMNGTDTIITQAHFNRDSINGFGSSGFNIDPTKLNVFRISYGWLGGATISFRVLSPQGDWILFHVIEQPNSSPVPSVLNPILPIRAQVKDSIGGSVLELRTASWNTGLVGCPNNAGARYFSVSNSLFLLSLTETHILTIRNKVTYANKPNKIRARIAAFGGGAIQGFIFPLTDNITILSLRKNATITGTVFSDINTENSIMEVSTTGVFTPGSGIEVFTRPTHLRGNGPGFQYFPQSFEVILLPGESISIIALSLSGFIVNTIGEISWEEEF